MHDFVNMAENEERRKGMLVCGLTPFQRSQAIVWFITFLTYTSFHMSRKPVSVVKSALHPTDYNNVTNPGFYPFNEDVNPTQVAGAGFNVQNAGIDAVNSHYTCRRWSTDRSYCVRFGSVAGQTFGDSAFALGKHRGYECREALDINSSTWANESSKYCWVIEANRTALTSTQEKALCPEASEERQCIFYAQYTDSEVPAPDDTRDPAKMWRKAPKWLNPFAKDPIPSVKPDLPNGKRMLGYLDTTYLLCYSAGLFISGTLADILPLRAFLVFGMLMSGLLVCCQGLIGMIYSSNGMHGVPDSQIWIVYSIWGVQGFFQSIGWPSVVAVMGNWFGHGKRGLLMGVWNSHTSFGNMLGQTIAGASLGINYFLGSKIDWYQEDWPAAFIIPGFIMICMGIFVSIFLYVTPQEAGYINAGVQHAGQVINQQAEYGTIDNGDKGNVPASRLERRTSSNLSESFIHGLMKALCIPGVVEFALALFFAKFVAYTFLYWLPYYLVHIGLPDSQAAYFSNAFDIGGIFGGICIGFLADKLKLRAVPSAIFMLAGVPVLYLFYVYVGDVGDFLKICWMLLLGFAVNGPYALITTAVSADLGQHESLRNDAALMATVTGIIDGTGSLGAAFNGIVVGDVTSMDDGWRILFLILCAANTIAAVMLARVLFREINECCAGGDDKDEGAKESLI